MKFDFLQWSKLNNAFVNELLSFKFISFILKNMINEDIAKSWKTLPHKKAKGILKLDKSLFTFQLKVLGLKAPLESIGIVHKTFKDKILKCPKLSVVKVLNDNSNSLNHKLLFLDPLKCYNIEKIKDNELEILNKNSIEYQYYDLEFQYENWLYDEILKEILPNEIPSVAGFSSVGHIAHMNLRDELLPFKYIIGEVIMDKISNIKTVVNKIQMIDNTYRNFQMELIAGEETYVTSIKEHGFTYKLDFSKVYWNSRLSTEHQRITKFITEKSLVFDVFAGVGPFSVPLAKKGSTVFANDLNPDSFYWLTQNMQINKALKDRYHLYNMDGREFIKTVFKEKLIQLLLDSDHSQNIHVIMNLPALACSFLDAFINLLPLPIPQDILVKKGCSNSKNDNKKHEVASLEIDAESKSKVDESSKCFENDTFIEDTEQDQTNERTFVGESDINTVQQLNTQTKSNLDMISNLMIRIHCYCFSKGAADAIEDARQKVEMVLKCRIPDDSEIRVVRNVSPNKDMLYIGFFLPNEVIFQIDKETHHVPLKKRLKIN